VSKGGQVERGKTKLRNDAAELQGAVTTRTKTWGSMEACKQKGTEKLGALSTSGPSLPKKPPTHPPPPPPTKKQRNTPGPEIQRNGPKRTQRTSRGTKKPVEPASKTLGGKRENIKGAPGGKKLQGGQRSN